MPKGVSPADFERFTAEIYAFYAEAEQVLIEKVARRAARGITEPGWAEAKLLETKALRAETLQAIEHLRAGDEQAARAVMEAYKDGSAQAVYDLEELLRTQGLPNGQPFVSMALPRTNQSTVQALAKRLTDNLAATDLRILRDVEATFLEAIAAGQRVSHFKGTPFSDVGRQAVAESVGKGMVTGAMNRREVAQDVLNRFADRGITGFVDKANRNWDLASYAEMAVRSATGQASVQGHIDKLVEHGYELFIVSDSPEECEVCRPWEREVLAKTEEAKLRAQTEGIPCRATVAEAVAAGLFHSSCSHRLGAYIHGLTEDVGNRTAQHAPDAYEDRQHQRYLERQVRRWKRREAAAMSDMPRRAAQLKTNEYQARIRLFIQGPAGAHDPRIKEHGWRVATQERTRRNDREQVRRGTTGKIGPKPLPPTGPVTARKAPPVPMPPVPQAAPKPAAWLEKARAKAAQGINTHQDAIELGKIMREEAEPLLRKNAEQHAELRKLWNDAEVAQRKLPWGSAEEMQANEVTKKVFETYKKLANPAEAARKVFGDMLRQLRPFGHVSEQPWHTGSRTQAKEAVQKVKNLFPTDWLEKAYGQRLQGKVTKKRAYYSHGISEYATNGVETTTAHEYMHHMEYNVPGVVDLERQFHAYRANGETPKWLGKGYGRDELAVRDKFIHAYMGKTYGGRAWEVMTMGTESLWYGTHGNLLLKDPEYLDFVLGVLGGA